MIGARYDRQIRLWGDEGQTSIQKTRVCVLGSSALASETLKSLVLAGIESFHVVDDALVTPTDLGQNFFVSEAQLGKSRAEAVVELLSVRFRTLAKASKSMTALKLCPLCMNDRTFRYWGTTDFSIFSHFLKGSRNLRS